MNNVIELGSGQEKYHVTDDWLYPIDLYNHPAID